MNITALAGVSLIATLFLLVLAILWMLVPFLIMGTNRRLDKIIAQNAARMAHAGVIAEEPMGLAESLFNRRQDRQDRQEAR
ncbi:MAG: hypothetical protein ABI790_05320 [Betaproteobacteria bacterium]